MGNWNCFWRTKRKRSTNDIDTTQGTPFLIYFLTVFMFIKELAFIINSSCCFSEGGKGGILGGGGDIGRFILHGQWIRHFKFSREKNNSYDQFFLLWLRTTAKELACSMSSPFSRFLFLVLWKRNRVLCLEVEARHHLLLIQNHCHQRSRHSIWSKTNGERVWIQSNFVAINRPEWICRESTCALL